LLSGRAKICNICQHYVHNCPDAYPLLAEVFEKHR
jgi:hypothetical protein